MTNAVSDEIVGREGMQHFDDVFETPKQFVIAPLGFVKRPGLFLKYVKAESGLSQLSISEASGWSRRSFPVCLVYFSKAALKRVSKVEDMKAVLEGEDIG